MPKKSKRIHKLSVFTKYSIHIWAILIFANAALAYAFHFSTHAAQPQKTVFLAQSDGESPAPTDIPTDAPANITPLPKGPVIDLTFTIPGIGSGGGTMNPKRTTRNLTVFLYSIDANSLNNNVKPLYTIKSTATYETDTNSPLYTTFSNHALDLGINVQDGDYQLAFRTDESLRTLIKDNPDNIGGQKITLAKDSPVVLPMQTVLMGDTIPKEGDNVIDISDYNAFINCFGARNTSAFCKQSNYGDFDDNGVIDGVDYNILLRTFRDLLKNGQAIPKVTPSPIMSPAPVKHITAAPTEPVKHKVTPTAKPQPSAKPAARGSIGGLLVSIFFLILLIVGIIIALKRGLLAKVLAIVHMAPTGKPGPVGEEKSAETPTQTTEEPQAATETPTEATATDASAIAASTEIPVETKPSADGEVEKSYYVKKKLADDTKTGFWLLLTDDNGAVEAHFTTKEVTDGFAKVKGVMKTENDKTYLEVTSLTPEG